jgi:hypothetical protein
MPIEKKEKRENLQHHKHIYALKDLHTTYMLWKMADMFHWSYEVINTIWNHSQKLLAQNIERRVL